MTIEEYYAQEARDYNAFGNYLPADAVVQTSEPFKIEFSPEGILLPLEEKGDED